jgi:hypothetical protein
MRVIKGCKHFWGSKIGKHLQLCGRAHYLATRKISRAEIVSKSEELVLGMFKDSALNIDAIRRSFLTKLATAAMFSSVQVDFGQPPLSSSATSSLASRNRECHIKTFDRFRA